jgi:hypothetical protein
LVRFGSFLAEWVFRGTVRLCGATSSVFFSFRGGFYFLKLFHRQLIGHSHIYIYICIYIIYIYIYIYIYGSVRLIVFPGSAEKNTDLSPLEDPTCSRWKSVCFVAFLELPIDFKPIVSKLTYVWELLDVEQIKLPINLVLLETPLNKIIMGRITIGFPAG